jgi:lipoyl(octanoyl) transferase
VTKNPQVVFRNLGLIDYKTAWDLQQAVFDNLLLGKSEHRRANTPGLAPSQHQLFFCEHPHTYTLGKNGNTNNLLASPEFLARIGAQFFPINRGGDITYHGPGQLVGYPILDLDHFFTDIHKYLRFLEEAIILTLADYGLYGTRSKGETGVWLDAGSSRARKICAMGIKASRWVTMHGFAFNINTDLNYFNHIVPCGIADKAVTSLAAELGAPQDFEAVSEKVKTHLAALFGFGYI